MKKIILSAIALATVSLVGAQTVKHLVVTDKEGKTTQFQADQIQAIIFEEAPEYVELTHYLANSYEEVNDNSGSYLLEFGTSEPDEYGNPLEIGDSQIRLVMQAPKSELLYEPELPTGYYRVGTGHDDFTFDVNSSAIWVRTDDTEDGISPLMIIGGTVDVRKDAEGIYDICMELSTLGGDMNLRYQGALPFDAGVSDYKPFTEPVNVEFEGAQGRFYGNWFYPFASDLTVQFYAGTITPDGVMTEGYMLELWLYEPKPEDCMAPTQLIADGTYTIENRETAQINYTYVPFRYIKGAYVDMMGTAILTGSRLTYLAETGHRQLGLITGGTITVSGNGTVFEFDLTTAEGTSVKGSYNGTPYLTNYCDNDRTEPKRPYSSLTEDIDLNWDPSTVALSYNLGKYIIEESNDFVIMFTTPSQDRGDYIYLELFCDDEALADGTYTIDSTLAAGHAIPGTIDFAGTPMFCWYGDLAETDAEGYNTKLAPIMEGTVTVSTLDNGERKFVFDLIDDNNHTIVGEYIGELINVNETTAKKALKMPKIAEAKGGATVK